MRGGFAIAVGLVTVHNTSSVAAMVCFRKQGDVRQLEAALKDLPEFKGFAVRKTIKVQNDQAVFSWPYTLKKPSSETVVALLDSVIGVIKQFVPAHDGKCDDCQIATVSNVTLVNNIPGFHCTGCQTRLSEAKEREAAEYASRSARFPQGILFGAAAAAAFALAWTVLLGWIELGSNTWYPKLHIAVSLLASMFVAWAFFKGAGKVNRTGQLLAVVLTLLGKFGGDAIFYARVLADQWHIPLSSHVIAFAITHFWALKLTFYGGWSIVLLLSDLGFAAAIPWMPWGKIPKFQPTFVAVQGDKLVPLQVGTMKAASAAGLS
ncbi:MAG TPA: hypothetical protein VNX88_22725 [Terriglobales bacterium]|nr:hypothetical protein [Terriglobales bacterium]